jgi:hypothetical protein
MILRPRFRVHNVKHPTRLGRRRRANRKPVSKSCWLSFSTWRGLCGRSSSQVALQSTLRIIKVCWNVYGTMYVEKDRRSGRMISCCSTTMLRATLPFSSINSCRTKNITVCLHPQYSTDLAPCDFWLFPKLKLAMKGKRFASIPEIDAATTTRLKD